MNAMEMAAIAAELKRALAEAGISVERADVRAGNVKAWETVPAEAIIGRWLQNGWKVTME